MHLIDLRLDTGRLLRFVHSHGHNRGGDEDLGYALHAWLAAVCGELAPLSYRVFEQKDRGLRLLGYAPAAIEQLREHVALFAEPLPAAVCDWEAAVGKAMPDAWLAGRRLRFELRACPVSRGKHGERDVFLAAVDWAKANAATMPEREPVYCDWLTRQFTDTAELHALRMTGFRLVSSYRRCHDGNGRAHASQRLLRPDALLEGECTIRDPDAFSTLLARGIGRHRAFGFGMLLLKPSQGKNR